ncbi:MAG: hypothetical protein C0603_03925 [Denitrovibrio sp.]|nr:MAG: hypothetical protein C0603_03925 [Denitrovibrio sp.]
METKKILLIEDEEQFRNGAKIALRKMGYQVIEACNGFEGIQLLMSASATGNIYHLIILDIMMPKVSGTDVLEYLIHRKIQTPVLVINGYMNYDVKCFCSRLKEIDVLEKPFVSHDFYETVNKIIDKHTGDVNA